MIKWNVITVGRLSRNRFWGESEDKPYRDVLCTSTLIRTGEHNIVVDPSLDGDDMAAALFNASGLKLDEIDLVYMTHKHADHCMGLSLFKNAKLYMSEIDYNDLKDNGGWRSGRPLSDVSPVSGELCRGVRLIGLPGHTLGLSGLQFIAREGRILVSGDCIMTKDFFDARTPYYFCQNPEMNVASIDKAGGLADVIVPGHGNCFVNTLAAKADK